MSQDDTVVTPMGPVGSPGPPHGMLPLSIQLSGMIDNIQKTIDSLQTSVTDFASQHLPPNSLAVQQALLDLGAMRDRLNQFKSVITLIDQQTQVAAAQGAAGS